MRNSQLRVCDAFFIFGRNQFLLLFYSFREIARGIVH